MKQLLLLFIISFFTIELTAQACMPNEMYRDSAVGVYPAPYDPVTNPEGGITESACIGAGYEFVLTFKVPSTINFGGVDVQLDSIAIDTFRPTWDPDGYQSAVGGLPIGLHYECYPDDCFFTPADTLACMVIRGIPSDVNTPGVFPLTIKTFIYTSLFDQEITFPNAIIPGADGTYDLVLDAAGSPNCTIAGTDDYLTKNISVFNSPNPFGSTTNFEINSKVDETLQFRVFDMLGKIVQYREVEIFQGDNNFEFDGTALANGIYTYTLCNKTAIISKKMVISR